MAVRIRRNGQILCAAMYPKRPGDVYLNDSLHYRLSVELKVLVTEDWEKHKINGKWWWKNEIPDNIIVGDFYKD